MADALSQSLGNWYGYRAAIAGATNFGIAASTSAWAAVFESEISVAITHLGFRYGARTGTPPTYAIALEGVDTGGLPDGTDVGGGSPTSATFTPPASTAWNGTWQWVALTNSYTPTRGQRLCATIRYSSGTIDASNTSSFTRELANTTGTTSMPYMGTMTASVWTRQSAAHIFGYRTASGRYGQPGTGVYSTSTSTSGNRKAIKFVLPSGHGSTFQVAGANLVIGNLAAASSSIFGLWNGAGTALQSVTRDSDQSPIVGTTGATRFLFTESTLATLSYGTAYYIGLESVSSSAVAVCGIQLDNAADRSAYPNGTNCCLSTWDGSTWTDDTTVVMQCDLILADSTIAADSARAAALIGGSLVA